VTEQECLAKMVAPGTRRPGKFREGVIQIHVTRACDKACFACTQGSNLAGKVEFMSPEQFDAACKSLKGYYGVVGVFGGNPALSPYFADYCRILVDHFPREQRGLWCNHPKGKGAVMRATFDPAVSNLNVHLDREAYNEFRRDWPEAKPFGLDRDSRHSPPFVSMRDVGIPENRRFELISNCDINQHWSALIGVFRGQLRAWFCEIAGAQAMLHQHEPSYPDTGIPIRTDGLSEFSLGDGKGRHGHWWREPIVSFTTQVRKHCHECGVPLRGAGELSQSKDPGAREQCSDAHLDVYLPKRIGRRVELVTVPGQLGGSVGRVIDYLKNGG